MKFITKIQSVLAGISSQIVSVENDWWIIGGAALALRGVDIGETHDIDILTNQEGAEEFKTVLSDIRENMPKTKEDNLFRSSFARFLCGPLDIEVMGSLELNVNGEWELVEVKEYDIVYIGELSVKLPTLSELKRILLSFGREKDLRRVEAINRLSGC